MTEQHVSEHQDDPIETVDPIDQVDGVDPVGSARIETAEDDPALGTLDESAEPADDAQPEPAEDAVDGGEDAVDGDAEESVDSAAEDEDPREAFRRELLPQAGRVVRGAHLLRHGEAGEVQPREPHHLLEHGGLHPRGRGPHRGRRGDQERPAQDGQPDPLRRLRAGPHGPHRRVLGRRAAHAVGHRLRRPRPPAGAAEHGRGRELAGPDRSPRPRPRPPRRARLVVPAAVPRPSARSRSPTSPSPTR